jgi:hypothetical protein
MKVKDLKNYGKSLLDCEPDPKMIEREGTTRRIIRQELERELGQAVTRELMSVVKKETDQMKSQALSVLSNRGLRDERFIESVIRRIALMKALSDVVGVEKASAIQYRLVEKTIWELMSPMWPSVEDYKSCGNFFEAFREYSKSTMAANVRAGLHDMEIVDDSPSALAYNIKYCVWHEIAKSFGNPYLCYPSTCYGDEVTIPRVLDKTGYRFRRAGTLAQGAQVCDFRYECLTKDFDIGH